MRLTTIDAWKKAKITLINENIAPTINEEGEKDYKKAYIDEHKMITHESIKSVEDIEKLLMASEGELNTFLKSKGIDYPVKLEIQKNRNTNYFKFKSEQIKPGSGVLGLFEKVVEYAQYSNFGGASVLSSTWNEQFYFAPTVWFGDLHLDYKAITGGSNGMAVVIDTNPHYNNPSATIWFDILLNEYKSASAFKSNESILTNESTVNEGYTTDRAIKDYSAEIEFFKKEKEKGKKEISVDVAGLDFEDDDKDMISIDKVIKRWESKLKKLKDMKEKGVTDAEKFNY